MQPRPLTAVIFGAKGQDGQYLAKLLESKSVPVIRAARSSGTAFQGDVADFGFVSDLVRKSLPSHVFHFAADSTTRHDALFANHDAVSTGTLNILESVRLYAPWSRVFLCGSALQFANDGRPINEGNQFEAGSAYAVARIQSAYAARYFRSTFGIRAYLGYLFNHDSPLRSERHVNQKVVQSCLRIAAGNSEKLKLENLDFRKEFNHASDIVEAIWMLVNQDVIMEAVIGSGKAYSIRNWVEICFSIVGLDWRRFVDVGLSASLAPNPLVSDPKVIMGLGWFPKHTIQTLALDMMRAVENIL